MPMLYVVQNQLKRQTGSAWVPRVAMDAVAARLSMPPIRVYEGRNLLSDVQHQAGWPLPSAGLYDDAVLAAGVRRSRFGLQVCWWPQGF